MGVWVNRTVLSGSSINRNGTTSHICTFTAATQGNLLVAVVAGIVTFTTPSGWTLVTSGVNTGAIYVFAKIASSGESSFSTTHNASNTPIFGVVYEYSSGTTVIGSNSATGQAYNTTTTGPSVSSLTGTYTRFAARVLGSDRIDTTFSAAWTLPSVKDYDALEPRINGVTDGLALTIAYDDNATGTSFNPSAYLTSTNTNYGNGEGVAFALSIGNGSATGVTAWLRF